MINIIQTRRNLKKTNNRKNKKIRDVGEERKK